MPIFEYKCPECGAVREMIQGVWDANPPLCCGVWSVKLVSAPAPPQFKGSGFYATDYKGKP